MDAGFGGTVDCSRGSLEEMSNTTQVNDYELQVMPLVANKRLTLLAM